MNRDNLAKLASYLEKLPADWKHFDMDVYLDAPDFTSVYDAEDTYAQNPDLINSCGTVACALGHGPAAGIKPNYEAGCGISWWDYGTLNFTGSADNLYDWLFSSFWSHVDNTHHGAAARIRYVLAGRPIPSLASVRNFNHDLVELYKEFLTTP